MWACDPRLLPSHVWDCRACGSVNQKKQKGRVQDCTAWPVPRGRERQTTNMLVRGPRLQGLNAKLTDPRVCQTSPNPFRLSSLATVGTLSCLRQPQPNRQRPGPATDWQRRQWRSSLPAGTIASSLFMQFDRWRCKAIDGFGASWSMTPPLMNRAQSLKILWLV